MLARTLSSALVVAALLPAQAPVLAPTSSITISTSGSMHYSSILIPAGVTVRFIGQVPAVLTCDGDCIVHGTLSATGDSFGSGPGATTAGTGAAGAYCGYNCGSYPCACSGYSIPAGPGVHHGVYGTVIPFSLDGGSAGGATLVRFSSAWTCCLSNPAYYPGAGGGGTLVVLAGGVIDIDGMVDVRPGIQSPTAWPASVGSAGSVLLRGAAGTILRPGGQIQADGATSASGGEVRLDAWGSAPVVQGIIDAPAPVAVELPHLRALSAPTIGNTWVMNVHAPANSLVFVAAAAQPLAPTPTPFGDLAIDLIHGDVVGFASCAPGHDPRALISWAIPNAPQAVGLPLWLQGVVFPPTLPPRLTNAVTAIVQ